MKSTLIVLLSFYLLIFIGCGGSGIDGRAPKIYDNVKEMVAEANAGIEKISLDEFNTKMDSDDLFILLDVREPSEYEEDNIPGSINIPRGLLEFKILNEKFWDAEGMFIPEKEEEIIVYCKKGSRGALVAETLVKLGFENVKNLHGGWVVWKYGPEALEEEEEKAEEGGCGG